MRERIEMKRVIWKQDGHFSEGRGGEVEVFWMKNGSWDSDLPGSFWLATVRQVMAIYSAS
ncbi:hypothetical protein AW736_01975 [Termitidicoccus mucosus]|uniref:Uncharacterized protein n=1 Tax=Termitidicoccus mucosus TaxID=1184151 RepID=A0A178IP48_9BACT|nr:hypothetical protein AW736_01975 [Opitutaceae bacterium TSB47]